MFLVILLLNYMCIYKYIDIYRRSNPMAGHLHSSDLCPDLVSAALRWFLVRYGASELAECLEDLASWAS